MNKLPQIHIYFIKKKYNCVHIHCALKKNTLKQYILNKCIYCKYVCTILRLKCLTHAINYLRCCLIVSMLNVNDLI